MHLPSFIPLLVCCFTASGVGAAGNQAEDVPDPQKRMTLTTVHFDALDGLSSNCVYHITRDAHGFIWAATSKGLDRFDGKRFDNHLYANMVGREQRVAQVLIQMQAQSDTAFQVRLSQDLLFKTQDTVFTFLPLNPEAIAPALNNDQRLRKDAVFLSGRSLSWKKNGDSIALFEHGRQVSQTFEYINGRPWSTWSGAHSDIPVLYRSSNMQMDILFIERDTIQRISTENIVDIPPTQGHPHPFFIRNDEQGLWYFSNKNTTQHPVGTLLCRSRNGQETVKGHWDDWFPFPLKHNKSDLFLKVNPWTGDLWCFFKNTLFILDPQGRERGKYELNDNLQFASLINAVKFTSDDEAWVGSCKGLHLIHSHPSSFEAIFDANSATKLDSKRLGGVYGCRGIVELGPDSFAFVTNGNGVRLHHAGQSRRIAEEFGVGAALAFRNDTLFIATRSGFGYLDRSGVFKSILDQKMPIPIWTMTPLDASRWLIGTDNVHLLDISTGTSKPLDFLSQKFLGNVYQIEHTSDTVWAITSTGIHGLDLNERRWHPWKELIPGAPSIPEAHHRLVDSRGHHWVSTASNGLIHWNPESTTIVEYGPDLGLPSTTVYGGVESDDGTLWFSTDNGMFKLNPATAEVQVYEGRHGIHETEFNRTGLHRGESGMVYFSTINGLVRFHPNNLPSSEASSAPLVITSLLQHRSSADTVEDVLGKFQEQGQLILDPQDDFLSIRLALLEYRDIPQKFRYRTLQTDGTPSEWFTIEEPEINLSGLSPRDTQIEIQARLRGNPWGLANLIVPIDVRTPWYQDPFRMTILGVLFGLMVWLGAYIRLGNLRKRNTLLETTVEERTRNLKESLELQEVYLKEVHHRVKNNLQIIGSLLDLQAARETEPATRKALSAGRSRIESISLVHQHLYLDPNARRILLNDFISEYVQHVQDALLEEEDAVHWELSGDEIHLAIEEAQPFGLLINELLTNSLRHAFKPKKQLRVSIHWWESAPGILSLEYEDNGSGIPEGKRPEQYTSLGLRLIHRLTKQLKGNVAVDESSRSQWTFEFECNFQNNND